MHKNYDLQQMTLDLSTDYMPDKTHIVWSIHELVESLVIDNGYIFGRPREYDPRALLKLLLFSYSRGVFTSRQIQQFAEENLPARWLLQEKVPSYRTICRFRQSDELSGLIQQSFEQFVAFLRHHRLIDDALFIDGTKLLADANKYSFVWKKNTYRFEEMNQRQISALLDELKTAYHQSWIPEETPLTLDSLEEIITRLELTLETLEEQIEADPKKSPNPDKQMRRALKSRHRKLTERRGMMENYHNQKTTFNGRGSYSKTDHDATFMRMKEDPMRNGQLKPGYNLQVMTNNQHFLAYHLFPNPTDTRTLIPFLEVHRKLVEESTYIVADAGYGSQPNFEYLEDHFEKQIPLIPHPYYRKEQTRQWKQDPKKVSNWIYNEADDYYITPEGVRFHFNAYRQRTDKYGYPRDFKEYVAERVTPEGIEVPGALTAKGNTRKILINQELEYYKGRQRERLAAPEYAEVYRRRKIDVEPAFGHLKACLRFTRFNLRGFDKVMNEMGLALMAANLRKLNTRYHSNKISDVISSFFRSHIAYLFKVCSKYDVNLLTYVTASYLMRPRRLELPRAKAH